MTNSPVRLCALALLLSGSIFLVACGSDNDNDNLANTNGTSGPTASASPTIPTTAPGNTQVPPRPTGAATPNPDTNYGGAVDRATCDAISGWIWLSAYPDRAIPLEIYVDNKLQTKLNADQLRPDLHDAGIGTGKYAFVFPIPPSLKDGKPHSYRVQVAGSSYKLDFYRDTPRTLTCKP